MCSHEVMQKSSHARELTVVASLGVSNMDHSPAWVQARELQSVMWQRETKTPVHTQISSTIPMVTFRAGCSPGQDKLWVLHWKRTGLP